MSKFFHCFLYIVFSLCLLSCAPLNIEAEDPQLTLSDLKDGVDYHDFETILKKAGCQDFQPHVWNYIYNIVSIENGTPPPYYTVRQKIIDKIEELMTDHPASKEDIRKFATRFVEIYALVTEFMDQNNNANATETLVQAEYGVTENNHNFITSLTKTLAELDRNAKTLNQHCQQEESTNYAAQDRADSYSTKWDIDWFFKMKKETHPIVYGARKVMSTAYQSCSVLDIPLMPIGDNLKGIKHTSRNGNGWRRIVTNLTALNNSHYYLKQAIIPSDPQCMDVHNEPLIYDYGGKPSTSFDSINLFTNSGSGSKSLGVDCSGFVTSAMASAGLRLKRDIFIRPIHVKGISSWMFKNAKNYNFSCLQQQDISYDNPIRPGDIIASNSHVFIVEFADKDPFNLMNISNQQSCHSSTIKPEKFKITVIQSSAHNNGVGINRMHIKDAISNGDHITRGLKRTASRACYKMFQKSTHNKISEISILRHASDVFACRDREIYLSNQECLKSCEPTIWPL